MAVSTHSRLKAAGKRAVGRFENLLVSTHSRLKAAGDVYGYGATRTDRFNTQPPEGGWVGMALLSVYVVMFQHTAA